MSEAHVVRPSEGKLLEVLGDRIVVKTHGTETHGRFSLLEFTTPKNGGPPPHRHAWREGYWVLDGEIEFVIDGKKETLTPGSWLLVHGGTIHTSKVLSDRARYLMLAEPAGVEDFLAEVHDETADDPANLAKILEIASRHGLEAVTG
jgi:quercetin dioxygenase-like cupin family protein